MVLASAHHNVTQRGSSEITLSVHDTCPNYTCDIVHELVAFCLWFHSNEST